MFEYLAALFPIVCYLIIVAIIAYWIYPLETNVDKYFEHKVVWITGASSGIGRQLAKQLIRLSPSTRLVLSARRENELFKLQRELGLDSDRCLVLPMDLDLHHDCFRSKVELVLQRFGQIDVLINNAGISQRSLIIETNYRVDAQLMHINYLGTITLSKTVLQHFIERQKGHFVVVTSATGYVGTPMRSAYAASKHALHGFFDSLRLEHANDHVDVTIVCPGFVRTDISINALAGSGVKHGQMDPKTERGQDPAVCAVDMLQGISKRQHELYVGTMAAPVIYLRRFCPALLYRVLLRMKAT